MLPAQQDCPCAPQVGAGVRHAPDWHTRGALQTLPGQQVWPLAPQAAGRAQTSAVQVSPRSQRPLQQGWSASPQGGGATQRPAAHCSPSLQVASLQQA